MLSRFVSAVDDRARYNNPMLNVFDGAPLEVPPVWLMRQAGRYLPEYQSIRAKTSGFLEMCLTPEYAAEITMQPIRRFDFDAAIVFADILLVPRALGQSLDFIDSVGPVLEPVNFDDLHFEPILFDQHMAPVYETFHRVREQLAQNKALIGFAGAPWTVAAYMLSSLAGRDLQRAKTIACQMPQEFDGLMQTLIKATTHYLIRQVEAGAQILQIFDSWAGLLTADQCQKWVIEPTAAIICAIRAVYPEIPIIGFAKGVAPLKYAKQTLVSAINLDCQTDLEEAREQLPCVLQGGIDPEALVMGGDTLKREVMMRLEAFAGIPYIVNLSHGILPQTPVEHVEMLLKWVRG